MPTSTTGDGTSPARWDSPSSGLPNKLARGANGIDYAYRDTGPKASGGVPLALIRDPAGLVRTVDYLDAARARI